MTVALLVDIVRAHPDCVVREPRGMPEVASTHVLPGDMRLFYELCGGIELYRHAPFGTSIVGPGEVLPSNVVIAGEQFPTDRSASWYVISRATARHIISIDLSPARSGLCYDSFDDVHGIAGSCPVIAPTFTDLLRQLIDARGEHWFWLEPDFAPLGDAYD